MGFDWKICMWPFCWFCAPWRMSESNAWEEEKKKKADKDLNVLARSCRSWKGSRTIQRIHESLGLANRRSEGFTGRWQPVCKLRASSRRNQNLRPFVSNHIRWASPKMWIKITMCSSGMNAIRHQTQWSKKLSLHCRWIIECPNILQKHSNLVRKIFNVVRTKNTRV